MAGVGMAVVVAVFMVGVEEASTAVVAWALAAEAGRVGGRIRNPLPAMQVPVQLPLRLRAHGVDTHRGPVTIILDQGAILPAGTSGLEIPRRRHLQSPTDGGIPLAAQQEA
jgi:hypothetical protein